MAEVVMDASAILAVLFEQPAAAVVAPLLPGSLVSAVNFAEVVRRLSVGTPRDEEVRRVLGALSLLIIPFDPEDAWATGLLRRRTRSARLSLGDRACLSLALSRGIPAVTTDRAWARLGLGAAVKVVGR